MLIKELIESSDKMNYKQFVTYFVDDVIRGVVEQYGENDITAAREAFNDLLDSMNENGDLEDDNRDWAGLPDWVEQRMENGEYSEYDSETDE